MPRIRTIKPEFWLNEELARLPEHARLLAIALLNHADDKGCFMANPHLVRAACFPFEPDSRNVTGSLRELSRIGYVDIRDCDGKAIGRICKFLQHQKINKPQGSRLLSTFEQFPRENSDSGSIPVAFPERSGNGVGAEGDQGKEREREQGKEGEGEGKNSCASAAPSHQAKREKYPPDFEAFWQAFPAERRRGKPDALKAWKRAIELTEPQTLIDAAKRYAVSPKAKAGFARMPATWLRAEAWTEDEAAWQGGHTPTAGERRQQRNDEVIGKFFGGSSDGSEGSFAGLIRDLSGGAE